MRLEPKDRRRISSYSTEKKGGGAELIYLAFDSWVASAYTSARSSQFLIVDGMNVWLCDVVKALETQCATGNVGHSKDIDSVLFPT